MQAISRTAISLLSCSAFLLLLAASSCNTGDDIDVTPPSMAIESMSPAPAPYEVCGSTEDTVFTLRGGETLRMGLAFTDDASLSQYKVDIHNNFDCHGHGGSSAPGVAIPNVSSLTEDWTELSISPLSGTAQAVQLTLQAPENVTAGVYHFQIQVLDESGNDNPLANFYSIRAINPQDEEAPALTVNLPAGQAFSAAKGSSIRFQGDVADGQSLSEGGNGLLFLSYTDLSSGNTFATDAVVVFDEGVDNNYAFDFEYTVPATLKAGNYRFRLDAFDGVRNAAAPAFFEVTVTD